MKKLTSDQIDALLQYAIRQTYTECGGTYNNGKFADPQAVAEKMWGVLPPYNWSRFNLVE